MVDMIVVKNVLSEELFKGTRKRRRVVTKIHHL
jgi:hypothetical protein